jgi:ubiquinone/menaquinone biosynthesis C-methylase UbiE
MKLFREENIQKIIEAIELDEYNDTIQDENIKQDDFLPEVTNFLNLFVKPGNVLEIGCGSGDSLGKFGITHGIEPCENRFNVAAKKSKNIKRGVCECIEFENDLFDSVMMINGFFQVRSDYESLIEVNRVLKTSGVFIFNLLINDDIDVVCGRCIGYKNYIRLLSQFGFEKIAEKEFNAGQRFYPNDQKSVILAFRKVRNFDNKFLNLIQIENVNQVKNFILERDWRMI